MTQWALINTADNAWISGPLNDEPTSADGQRKEMIPVGWPDTWAWSSARGGFVAIEAPPLISVGRFKLLFTQGERIALRQAATQDVHVADFLDLLAGFTDGVSLSDPVMIGAIGQLQAGGLVTAERAKAILAGQAPS